MKEKHFPSAAQAAFLLLANFLLQYVFILTIHDLQGWLNLEKYQQSALASLLANGMWLAAVIHFQNGTYLDLFHPSKSSYIATGILLGPAVVMLVPLLLLVNLGLMEVLVKMWTISNWEEEFFGMFRDSSLAVLLSVAVLAPILEEMIFRGVLLRAFLNRYPKWPAIAISALFFGFAHLNIYQFALAFPMGLLLGWLFERSRSLIPCITLHATFNGSTLALNQLFYSDRETTITDFSSTAWFISGVTFAAGAWFLVYVLKTKSNEYE